MMRDFFFAFFERTVQGSLLFWELIVLGRASPWKQNSEKKVVCCFHVNYLFVLSAFPTNSVSFQYFYVQNNAAKIPCDFSLILNIFNVK